ncbi:hypothetical protein EK21DRAFT_60467 [Setomelanomma holmii]|uniref:Uncharacterized protein n=1 Tax=Setomelanomma holmii TaxID=210430 RepID=A0A9P4HDH8_9PLEO|nr:hypothetical protein EK21DRAFT_60467 [Setomelanomma holmii]
MLKRKPSQQLNDRPHALTSIFEGDPTRRQRKRLFRSKNDNKRVWQPATERAMTELLDFILKHEEAFQNQYRLASLYADFRQQLEINPEGYHANISAWTKALSDAARAGVISSQGATHNILNIRASDELARALQHPQHGKPTCLPAVFHDAVQKKEMILLKDFLNAKESIYKNSWLPSPWTVLRWGLRQVGVLSQPKSPEKLSTADFVVLKNVEVASDEIMKKMREHTSTADRILSRAEFLKRYSSIPDPTAPLTNTDLDILLLHLARDKLAISYNASAIKFKPEHDALPEPITQEDEAIANLRETLANINAQIQPLHEKVVVADIAAREAVAAKQMVRAKAALRSKKLAETALAQRTDVALQLESVFTQLEQAADHVEIVAAMRAGADALKSLNEKVGGAEGVQGVVDAVNEQMTTTEEIMSIINETDQPLDEAEIDDEFEALEKAEADKVAAIEKAKKDKEEQEAAARTAVRLAELTELEKKRREKETEEQLQKSRQNEADEKTEADIDDASNELSRLSFQQSQEADGEMNGVDGEKRVPIPA